jgi:hypothetical protein
MRQAHFVLRTEATPNLAKSNIETPTIELSREWSWIKAVAGPGLQG